jgi:hypothetical protein
VNARRRVRTIVRALCPWWVLCWMNERFGWCWTTMVTWKVYGDDTPWRSLRACALDVRQTGTCYCGKYSTIDRWNPPPK